MTMRWLRDFVSGPPVEAQAMTAEKSASAVEHLAELVERPDWFQERDARWAAMIAELAHQQAELAEALRQEPFEARRAALRGESARLDGQIGHLSRSRRFLIEVVRLGGEPCEIPTFEKVVARGFPTAATADEWARSGDNAWRYIQHAAPGGNFIRSHVRPTAEPAYLAGDYEVAGVYQWQSGFLDQPSASSQGDAIYVGPIPVDAMMKAQAALKVFRVRDVRVYSPDPAHFQAASTRIGSDPMLVAVVMNEQYRDEYYRLAVWGIAEDVSKVEQAIDETEGAG